MTAPEQYYTVATSHIQRLIGNGMDLARRCHGKLGIAVIGVEDHQRPGNPEATVESALRKAANDLRHAASELDAEADACLGWAQV